MDPDANLDEQRTLARRLITGADRGLAVEPEALRLAELALALDDWITRGGFLPRAWTPR
jgi:hypothetical protein